MKTVNPLTHREVQTVTRAVMRSLGYTLNRQFHSPGNNHPDDQFIKNSSAVLAEYKSECISHSDFLNGLGECLAQRAAYNCNILLVIPEIFADEIKQVITLTPWLWVLVYRSSFWNRELVPINWSEFEKYSTREVDNAIP